jgi:hypothetical protein
MLLLLRHGASPGLVDTMQGIATLQELRSFARNDGFLQKEGDGALWGTSQR